jgi:autotransporter-associated beta strand protein
MSAAANWSLGAVPTLNDVARWNYPGYTYQPSLTNAMTFGQLLFGDGNSSAVTIGGSSALTLNRLEGVGIQMTNGSGAVTINAPITLGLSQSWINNNPPGGNALTVTNTMSGAKRLTVAGSGDTIVGDLATGSSTLTMNGTGALTLGGSANNAIYMIVNSGTVKFNKGGTAKAITGGGTASLFIGGVNATPATVQYTGASTNMLDSTAYVYILGGGRLDINGGTQYPVPQYVINSMGAAGDTTPLMNSGSGGTLYLPNTYVVPRPGYTTTLDSGSGSGTLSMNGGILYSCIAGSYGGLSRDGRVQINGKINVVAATFYAFNGDAADDLTINAAISGAPGVGITVTSIGTTGNNTTPGARVVLPIDNSGFSGPVTAGGVSGVILNIRHGNALGTPNAAYVTTVNIPSTLELQGGITVGAQPLSLIGSGIGVGALRNVSGNNSWNGPITTGPGSNIGARINSDSGTLTLSNNATISSGLCNLSVGGMGNVNIFGNIDIVNPWPGSYTLLKDGAGKLTLSAASLKTGPISVNGGTLALDLSSGSTSKTWLAAAALTLSKGAIELKGGSQTELFNSTILNAGSFSVTSPSGASKLRMNTLTRAIGGTIDFAADNLVDTDTANANGLMGVVPNSIAVGFATVASNSWAINSTGAGDGPITALPLGSYTANTAGSLGATTANADMSGGVDTTIAAGTSINSIRFNDSVARTITINAGQALTISSGGILVTPNVGAFDNVITSGALYDSNNQAPLTIHQYNTAGKLNIYSVFAGSKGFVKAGPGTLSLGGTTANTQSGTFIVNGGTLELNKTANVNAIANGGLVINQTGIVKYTGSSTDMIGTGAVTINEAGQLDFNGKSDTIGAVTINSTGAGGNTTPIKNTIGGGTLTISSLTITPVSGYTTTVNSASGTLALGGDVTFGRAGNGVVQLSGNINMGAAARGFYPQNGDADADVIVDAVLSGTVTANNNALTVRGNNNDNNGRLVLSGNNTFTGNTTIGLASQAHNVVLNLQHSNALGATGTGHGVVFTGNGASTLELQGGISVGNEPLSLTGGGYMNYGVLRNVSGNNSWAGAITLAGVTRINSDSDTLTLNSGTAISGAQALYVGGLGNTTISSAIGIGAGTLTKDGAGTLTLSGANTLTGATTVNGGTLVLDYSTQNNTKLADGAALNLYKGTLTLNGGSHTDLVASTTLNSGAFVVNRSSGTSVLRMNAITRTIGSTIDFAAGNIADTDTSNYQGILGISGSSGYATVGSNTWAVSATAAADTLITGLPDSGYVSNSLLDLGTATSNCNVSVYDTFVVNNFTINSIRFNETAQRTLTLCGTLTVTSGGILNTATVGANTNTITGATLTSTTDLKIHQYNTSAPLRIDSPITIALTKSGPGTLILGGFIANSGNVVVNGGELDLDKAASQAIAGTATLTINQNGIVKYTNSNGDQIGTGAIAINEAGQLDFNGASDSLGGALTINSTGASGNTTPLKNSGSGGNLTWGSSWSITPLTGYRTLIDSGTGTNTLGGIVYFTAAGSGWAQISGNLSLSNASRDFSVPDGDAFNDMVVDATIVGGGASGALSKSGVGRLVLSGNNSYDGLTTVNGGFLTISNAAALGASGGSVAVNGTTVNAGFTLELLGGITVGAEALSLNSTGLGTYGALRNVSGNNSWGGPISLVTTAVRINSDKDTLTISGDVTSVGTFGLTIGGAGDTTISGALDVTSLNKDGTGALTLSGATKRTGAVTVSGGKLVLDYTGADNLKITDAGGPLLALAKSTLDLTGTGSATQSVGSVTLGAGQSAITRSSGSSVLRMKQITRIAGGTVDFASDGIADTDSVNANGILASTLGQVGFATVAGANWAMSADTGTNLAITALASYQANTAGITASISPNNADNVDMSAGDTTLITADTINSLRFNQASPRTITIGGGLTVTSGGILNTATVGANTNTIIGISTLTSATDLKIHQYNTGAPLRIDAPISVVTYGLTKSGPGTLILGGYMPNAGAVVVNGGELDLDKIASQAIAGAATLTINQNGIVKYTGTSSDQIGTGAIAINEAGQLDFNGKSDLLGGALTIVSTGANGDTTPIKNSGSGGNLTWGGGWGITPLTGYETLINSGTGTNTLTGNVTCSPAGSGTARISGNLALISNITFTVTDGEALDDLVIDAVISGSGSLSLNGNANNGHLVLGGANTFTNTVTLTAPAGTLNGGYVTITNGSALGTADGGTVVQTGTSLGNTLELRGGITVAAEPLTLSGMGQGVYYGASVMTGAGALRSYSGNNTWGGPVTLGAYSRISSDLGSLLTLTNTVNGAGFGLNVAGLGDVTINGAISSVSALTNDCLGTLTLGGTVANAIVSTVVNSGTVLLNKTSGAAVSNLTVNGGPSPLNGTYGLVRHAANSANPMISGTVTLNANMQGAGQLDFNGATDTLANMIINSTGAYADSRPIVNTGNGGVLTINALTITPVAEYITQLDSGTNGVLRLGGDVTFTAATTGQGTLSGALDLGAGTRTFNVGLGTGPIYDLGISAVITNGSLTKTGTGRLCLSGVNTYAGETLVNAGTLVLDNANVLGTNATLSLVSSNGVCGKVNLNFSGTMNVGSLRLDGVLQSGTWGSSSSTAENKSDAWFAGPGVLNVGGQNIVNLPVSGLTGTAANFNGQLISAGLSATQVGVLWGTTDGGISGAWANTNWFDGTWPSGTSFSTNISPLTLGNTYYYTYAASNSEAVLRAAPSVSFYCTNAGTALYWKGVNTDWANTNNWTNSVGQVPAQPPTALDDVFINVPASSNHPTLNLSSSPVTIKTLTLGTSLTSTLTVANGDVFTRLLRVEGDVTIGAAGVSGVLTHLTNTVAETHRLRLDVGANLTIAAGGQINVDDKGYAGGYGPGAGVTATYSGGGYGGEGGLWGTAAVNSPRGTTYGSVTDPVNNGSGPNSGANKGGGTAVLRVGGAVTHNGTITANGSDGVGGVSSGASGGSINIMAGTITGATGRITASGGAAVANNVTAGGGGGRIALVVTNAGATFPASVLTNTFACSKPGDVGLGSRIQYGAAGTIYLKTPANTYGDLIVNNTNFMGAVAYTLLRDGTYRFDSITTTSKGVLAVGNNAVLTLDGCTLRSDSTTNDVLYGDLNNRIYFLQGGRLLLKDNGQLNWTGTWTNNGVISQLGLGSYTLPGSLVVASNAVLTHEVGNGNWLSLVMTNGDLTVATNGAIWAVGCGYVNNSPFVGSGNAGGVHGGEGGWGSGGVAGTPTTPTYGSITNPTTAGGGSAGTYPSSGGGVVIVRASGVVTVNGVINANGPTAQVSGGAGGSVNIRAGDLQGSGSGRITADGGIGLAGNTGGGGGGGRIAVVLTNAMTVGNVAFSAVGGTNVVANTTGGGGAGTIYLKGANSAYGLLIVSNAVPVDRCTNIKTLISTQVTDTVVGDVQILGTGTKLVLSNTCTLTVYGSWSNAVATNAFSGGTVELEGTAPATIWGGNTWSNLVITNFGKVVSFQTNVIQYVYGIPAWSNNVMLKSTEDGTYWKLFKPSWGATQDVGVVNVQWSDAMLNSGATFRAAIGSTVSPDNTLNWTAQYSKGTVLLFR